MDNASLKNKKILLGITGSIAAYKSILLLRLLQKSGAEVQVVMTPSATKFVKPINFSTLSGHPVHTEIIENDNWDSHVKLGIWADLMLIAPLTANTLAKMYAGMGDNMVLACWLSAKCPIAVAPAMDRDMYKHPTTTRNIKTLQEWNHFIIPAEYGELASGLIGEGRMAEPETILSFVGREIFTRENKKLNQKEILVTAGPTYENIDPVRFIGNRSSGKMGIAIAQACAQMGAAVTLLLGPTHLKAAHKNIHTIHIATADELYKNACAIFPEMDAGFMVAAVSDYKVENPTDSKIKKSDENLHLKLIRNPDIAQKLGEIKKEGQFLCGFALETENGLQNAIKKLKKKNFDIIVLNSLEDEGAGFGYNTNKVTIVTMEEEIIQFPLMAKTKVAKKIVGTYIKKIEA